MAEAIEEHGEIAIKLADGAYCEPADVGEYLEDNYHGDWDSLEEYAADYLDQTGEVDQLPGHLRGYFDYESFARDLELGGDVFTIKLDGRTHVFSNR